MKKNYLACLSLILMSSAYAASFDYAMPHSSVFDGFYVNAGIGGVNAHAKDKKQTIIMVPSVFDAFLNPDRSSSANKLAGEIGVGFSRIFNHDFYAALEAQGAIKNTKEDFKIALSSPGSDFIINSVTTVKLKNDLNLLAKLGKLTGDHTVVYGLIGGSEGNFSISDTGNYHQNLGTVLDGFVRTHKNTHKAGIVLGAGIEHYVTKNFGIGAEYKYTNYGTLHFPSTISNSLTVDGVPNAGGALSDLNKIKFQTNTLMLKVNYHIAT